VGGLVQVRERQRQRDQRAGRRQERHLLRADVGHAAPIFLVGLFAAVAMVLWRETIASGGQPNAAAEFQRRYGAPPGGHSHNRAAAAWRAVTAVVDPTSYRPIRAGS